MAVDFKESGVPLLRISSLGERFASLDGVNFLDEEKVKTKWNHFRLEVGDLLISCSASTGIVSEVNNLTKGSIAYTGIIKLCPKTSKILKNYIRWFVISEKFLIQIELLQTGTTIQHFGPHHLNQMLVTLPPLKEQTQIAEFLDKETNKIDALVEKKGKSIELLKEYRTELISATVNGKIDVRGLAA